MANEITVLASLAFSKNEIEDALAFAQANFDVSGSKFIHNVQAFVSTDQVAVDKGNITTIGWVAIKNHDDTNYIEWFGVEDESATIKIKANEFCLFRSASSAPFIQANTGSCTVEYLLIED